MSEVERIEDVFGKSARLAEKYAVLYGRETDRGAAVLAAAMFEHRLKRLIEKKFVHVDKDVRKQMKQLQFAPTIGLGYALGLYDQERRRKLLLVGEIRNRFAHFPDLLTFDDEPIATKCRQLDATDANLDDLRVRYLRYLQHVEDSIVKNAELGL